MRSYFWFPCRTLCFFILFNISGYAKVVSSVNEPDLREILIQVKTRYKKAPSIKMKFNKEIKSNFGINKTEKGIFTGIFREKSSLFRMEIPKKSELLFDGTYIWSVAYPPKGIQRPAQVLRGRGHKVQQIKKLWSSILGPSDFISNFNILSSEWDAKNKVASYTLKAKMKSSFLKQFRITINRSARIIQSLSYQDELENKVNYSFSSVRLTEKIKERDFVFKIPKGSKVETF